VRLNQLRLKNFRQHGDTTVDFDTGLTGIIGPNGSGKTTILEGIAWALYGMPAARGTREGIRSLRAPARAGVKVELDFNLGGHRYKVARSLSSAELYLDGASTPIANSISGVSDLLRRRLGMSQQEFFNTYFTGQKELSVMASMGPAERAQFLSRVLGYERLRSAQVLVRDRRNVIRGEAQGMEAAMPESEVVVRLLADTSMRLAEAERRTKDALKRLKRAHSMLEEIEPKWAAAQKEREALQALTAELRLRESEEAAFIKDSTRLEEELAEIAEARNEIAQIKSELSVHKDLESQLHQMQALAQQEGRRSTLNENRRQIVAELAKLHERAASLATDAALVDAKEREREETRRELQEVEKRVADLRTDWARDKQEAITKADDYRSQYKETRDQREKLADLGPDGPCPICTRPLADHFREVLDDLDGRLKEIEVNGKYFASRVEQLKAIPEPLAAEEVKERDLKIRLEERTKAVTAAKLRAQESTQVAADIAARDKKLAIIIAEVETIPSGYHVTRHAELRHRHEQFAPLAARSARLGALTEREPQVKAQLSQVRKDLTAAKKLIAGLKKRQSASKFSEAGYSALRADHDKALAARNDATVEAAKVEKDFEAAKLARAAAEQAKVELERMQQRLRVLNTDRRLHDELDRAYSDMRADLNQHLRPELSDLASGYMEELSGGRYSRLELDEEYNVIVLEDEIPRPVLSGGEEDLSNLAVRLAISQMIAERAGQAFSLLVLDEVFGSLDDERRDNVVGLLRRLHDRFEQVVVITHIESMKDGLDRVLTVSYDEAAGISRITREAGPAARDFIDVASPDAYAIAMGGAD
jgi:exonuclease SbcC